MAASIYACTVPGSTSSSPSGVRLGVTVTTVGIAACAVSLPSDERARPRLTSPHTAKVSATMNRNSQQRRNLRPKFLSASSALGSGIGNLHGMNRVRRGAPMNDREYGRYEKQGGDGCKEEAADDRAAQRCILLAAVPQPQRHRDHADDHGQGRHENRP